VTLEVGLCGFTIAARDYPRRYPAVEVQQTFYQPPAATTLVRWRESMPADLEFTVKAWQLVMHATTSSTYRRLQRPLTDQERASAGYLRPSPIVDEGWAARSRPPTSCSTTCLGPAARCDSGAPRPGAAGRGRAAGG
jgi:uncharacterized protein YecE (DUF72 family)